MKSIIPILVITIITLQGKCLARKIPDFIPICHRNSGNFDKCVINSIEKIKPELKKGIPKLQVPAIEPLQIPQLQVQRDQENIKLKLTLSNLKAFGVSDFKINSLKTDLKDNKIAIKVSVPLLKVSSDYDINGKILLIPLQGKGTFVGNITDVDIDFTGAADLYKNAKGVKHLTIKELDSKIKLKGDLKFKLVNAESGTGRSTDTAYNFFKNHREEILEIVKPIVEETGEIYVQQVGNNILKNLPYDEVLPA